jgi:hypothetical protein
MWSGDVSRNLWWYAGTLSFQLPQAALVSRLAVADLFMLPLIAQECVAAVKARRVMVRSTLRTPLLCLLALFVISTIVGYRRMGSLSTWALLNKDAGLLLLIAVFAVLVRTIRSVHDAKRIARWFVGGVAIANITALVAAVAAIAGFENNLYLVGNTRLYGWMGNPSVNGGLLLSAGMIELGLLMSPPSADESRWWRWVNVWLMALGLALTLSRSTWLAAATASAALLVAAGAHAFRTREWRLSHVTAIAVWMILPVMVLGNIVRLRGGVDVTPPAAVAAELQARLVAQCVTDPQLDVCTDVQMPTTPAPAIGPAGVVEPTPDVPLSAHPVEPQQPSDASSAAAAANLAGPLMNARGLNDRVAIAAAALTAYRADPLSMLFGIGLGTFYATSGASFGVPLIIHNTFVWFLVEFGPLGLIVVLWIWGRTIVNLWLAAFTRNGGEYLACGAMAALAGLTMFCILNEGFYQRQLWLVFAIADRLYWIAAEPAVETPLERARLAHA